MSVDPLINGQHDLFNGQRNICPALVNGMPQKDNLDNLCTPVCYLRIFSISLVSPNFQHFQLAVPLVYKGLFCGGRNNLCSLYEAQYDDPTPCL